MSATRLFATAGRVLRQLRHDPRTVALLLVVPCALLTLLWWVLIDSPQDFDQYGPALLAIFPLIVMFLVTSIATLRERSSGTLERLLTMPVAKPDFLGGYALAFGAAATVQALLASGLSLGLLGMDVKGPAWAVVLVAVLVALLGTSLGLFVSAFAQTEFQAVQFMPAVILPQLLLCGIIAPTDQLPPVLEWVSRRAAADLRGRRDAAPCGGGEPVLALPARRPGHRRVHGRVPAAGLGHPAETYGLTARRLGWLGGDDAGVPRAPPRTGEGPR